MNYIRFYLPSVLLTVLCILLIRQCYKPYFINPNKARNPNFILNNRKGINIVGRMFTLLTVMFTIYYSIIPDIKDTICIVNNEYMYAVVETRNDSNTSNSSKKFGEVNLYVHPEFKYNPVSNQIKYVRELESEDKQWHTFRISLSGYEKGEYYVVKYLPNTLYGTVIHCIDNIEKYKK